MFCVSHNVIRTHSNKSNASFAAHVISMLRQQVLQIRETEASGPDSVAVYHLS